MEDLACIVHFIVNNMAGVLLQSSGDVKKLNIDFSS